MQYRIVFALLALAMFSSASSSPLADASNYRQYDELLASSGQPSAQQLEDARDLGFERIIYLAFSDSHSAIDGEDRVVKRLGLDYVHIPVDFDKPTLADFKTFASVMGAENTSKTLVHCEVNFRASTFSFLYRVAIQDVPMLEAKNDLDSVWAPNETWFRFLRSVLANYDLTPACAGCDWGANEFVDD